jgi:hypothetical protein
MRTRLPTCRSIGSGICTNAVPTASFRRSRRQARPKGVGNRTRGVRRTNGPTRRMARNLPNIGANWALDLAKLRHDVGEQMLASGGKQALVAKHLAMLDVDARHACCRIDRPRARSACEIVPAHFLDKHLMPQTIGLLHLGAIMIVVSGNQVNHSDQSRRSRTALRASAAHPYRAMRQSGLIGGEAHCPVAERLIAIGKASKRLIGRGLRSSPRPALAAGRTNVRRPVPLFIGPLDRSPIGVVCIACALRGSAAICISAFFRVRRANSNHVLDLTL